jgi:hypothetical protein
MQNRNKNEYDGFEVLTEETMKSSIFWDITPYSLVKVNLRCGRAYTSS